MKLLFNKVYVKNNKLCCDIILPNKETYTMWYEVEDKYVEYLCDDNYNSFLVALIPYIVKHEYDVVINGKISKKLYYQLSNYLILMLCKKFKKKNIKISAELCETKYLNNKCGASISGGIDSFYTLLKHKDKLDGFDITHLCFFNAGASGEYGGEEARTRYNNRIDFIKKFCDRNNCELVTIDSNMNELIMMNHEATHTFRTLACVYALEKLFSKYYFGSGLEFDGSHIDEVDTAYYDILNVHCLSNENIDFYISGIEASRLQKVKYIADFKETYDTLNVCVSEDINCGHCEKCIRTMTELESIGKLENYTKVFDLDDYYKNKNVFIAKALAWGFVHPTIKDIYKDTIKSYKENNLKIPVISKFIALLYALKIILKKLVPKKIIKTSKQKKINDRWTD